MQPGVPAEQTNETAEPPRKGPEPSFAPFMLALGITMVFWGLVTSPVMSAGGLTVFIWALWMWVREISQGWRN